MASQQHPTHKIQTSKSLIVSGPSPAESDEHGTTCLQHSVGVKCPSHGAAKGSSGRPHPQLPPDQHMERRKQHCHAVTPSAAGQRHH